MWNRVVGNGSRVAGNWNCAVPGGRDSYAAVLAYTELAVPSFSLRGGTREILRGIIARGLGLR